MTRASKASGAAGAGAAATGQITWKSVVIALIAGGALMLYYEQRKHEKYQQGKVVCVCVRTCRCVTNE